MEIKEIGFSYKSDEHMPDYESFREEYLQGPTHPSVVETRVGYLSRAGTNPSIRTTSPLDGQHSRQQLLREIIDLLYVTNIQDDLLKLYPPSSSDPSLLPADVLLHPRYLSPSFMRMKHKDRGRALSREGICTSRRDRWCVRAREAGRPWARAVMRERWWAKKRQ